MFPLHPPFLFHPHSIRDRRHQSLYPYNNAIGTVSRRRRRRTKRCHRHIGRPSSANPEGQSGKRNMRRSSPANKFANHAAYLFQAGRCYQSEFLVGCGVGPRICAWRRPSATAENRSLPTPSVCFEATVGSACNGQPFDSDWFAAGALRCGVDPMMIALRGITVPDVQLHRDWGPRHSSQAAMRSLERARSDSGSSNSRGILEAASPYDLWYL